MMCRGQKSLCSLFLAVLMLCVSSGFPVWAQSPAPAAQELKVSPVSEVTVESVTAADLGLGSEATSGEIKASTTGFTSHFRNWLATNGYSSYDFARDDVTGGSYGGKSSASDTGVNQPVIFIHGNSDKAIGTGTFGQSGWSASVDYFLSQGYKTSELYATTWGPANAAYSAYQYHSKTNLTRIRKFIEAVLAYTGAAKVDIISHSMGVTLGRKAVKGGSASDLLEGGSYDLGPSLTSKVDTFVGIAGANWGLVSCYQTGGSTPTCASTNGLYPGYAIGPWGLSSILSDLNATSHYEGSYVYTIWSTVDEVIGYGCVVWGRYTPQIPAQNGEKRYTSAPYGHFNSKDLTTYYQLRMVKFHSTT
ncbi:MAG TPA: lipase family protein [Acidobacteriota bacterium]|nr:lipase family protein [Acidobacteriota bacterium]